MTSTTSKSSVSYLLPFDQKNFSHLVPFTCKNGCDLLFALTCGCKTLPIFASSCSNKIIYQYMYIRLTLGVGLDITFSVSYVMI